MTGTIFGCSMRRLRSKATCVDGKPGDHRLLISNKEKRTDIVAYGVHFAISVPARPFDHITIIEMKRPGRKMEKFNPVQQIYNYVDDLREENSASFGHTCK